MSMETNEANTRKGRMAKRARKESRQTVIPIRIT